jgi:RNA-directed DNA polymerase
VIILRFADDIVLEFQEKAEADQFRAELTERMRKFHLELHPEKMRLLEFGPFKGQRVWLWEGYVEVTRKNSCF